MWRKNSALSSNLTLQWIHAELSRFSVFKVLRGKWKTSTVDIIVELNLRNILSYQYRDAGQRRNYFDSLLSVSECVLAQKMPIFHKCNLYDCYYIVFFSCVKIQIYTWNTSNCIWTYETCENDNFLRGNVLSYVPKSYWKCPFHMWYLIFTV